jgi:hypothetical protein
MKIHLTVQEILIWHDAPQLFVANDPIGGTHICVTVEMGEEMPQYLVVAISTARLFALKQGIIDLYSVFSKPELEVWFFIKAFNETHLIAEPMLQFETPPAAWLPTKGVFLTPPSHETHQLHPKSFEVVKVGAVAKEAGMNATLLRQYVSGVKIPSPEQARRVQDALHRVAQRLLQVHFV